MGRLAPKIGIYAGTFDPLTIGHLEVIKAGSTILGKLIVAVGVNRDKQTLFTLEERLDQIRESTNKFENVEVVAFEGLLADFAIEKNAGVLLRGLRSEADFVYEMQMASMNAHLAQEVQTIFVPTKQNQSHISSSLVKEVAKLGGDVSKFVSPFVYKALNKKFPNK